MELRIHHVAIEAITLLRPLVRAVERHDRDLGRQMRRSASSVPLNIHEGAYSQGRNRNARLHNALASAKETLSALEVAVAWGYLPVADTHRAADKLDHIVATLFKLLRTTR